MTGLRFLDEISTTAPEWLIPGVLQRSGVALLYGRSEVGKTFGAIAISKAVARGSAVFGVQARKAGVVYVGNEQPTDTSRRLSASFAQDNSGTPPIAAGSDDLSLHEKESASAFSHRLQTISEGLRERGAPLGLIVFDTVSAVTPGMVENDSTDVRAVIANARKISDRWNALVLLVHHSDEKDQKPRGSSAFRDDVETVLHLQKGTQGQPSRIILEKSKESPTGVAWEFRLRSISSKLDDGSDFSTLLGTIGQRLPDAT